MNAHGSMLERESYCGCPGLTPPQSYGKSGFHWKRSDRWPGHPQMDIAYEKCPAYRAAVREGG